MSTTEEYSKLIQLLERNGTPPASLKGKFDIFTVGYGKTIAHMIFEAIKQNRTHDVRIIVGDFGTGKTHTLSYLKELVEQGVADRNQNELQLEATAIMNLSLNRVQDNAFELQQHLIENMSIIRENGGSLETLTKFEALKFIYQQIKQSQQRKIIELTTKEQKVRSLLKEVIGATVEMAYPVGTPLYYLATGGYEYWRENRQVNQNTESMIEELAQSPTATQLGFIESFINNGESRTGYIEAYNSLLGQISKQWEYMVILLRFLKLAGYENVIILIDEAEQLAVGRRLSLDRMIHLGAQMLNQFHIFHQEMANAGEKYPAVFQVIAVPDRSLQDIRELNAPLADVWFNNNSVYKLGFVTRDSDEIQDIVKILHEFMIKAHEPVPLTLTKDEIKNLINDVYDRMLEEKDDITDKPGIEATMRNVIPRVIRALRKE